MASGAKVSRRTRNDLPEKVRAKVCGVLQARLLETIDLHWQVKQAHWTVRGENFIALHELFDKVAEHVNEFADEIAERIQMLGGHAVGTIQAAVKGSTLPPYPVAITASRDHVRAVSAALGAYGKLVRRAIDETDDAGDKDTADLFTGISREVDKQLWFVESHEG